MKYVGGIGGRMMSRQAVLAIALTITSCCKPYPVTVYDFDDPDPRNEIARRRIDESTYKDCGILGVWMKTHEGWIPLKPEQVPPRPTELWKL
ncbi:MAG: hypothetical protein ACYSVY_02945 [Planctomycetota bacterium]|jgi:hypothetical protein